VRWSVFGVLAAFAGCGGGGGETAGSGTPVDTLAPVAGTVLDGLAADVDTQSSTNTIAANWSGFVDDSGSIAGYRWAIGTTPGGTEIQGWTAVGTATNATTTSVVLGTGTTCFVAVVAFDAADNLSVPAISDGVTIQAPAGGGGSGGGTTPGTFATSVTQWGITWRFADSEQVGRFANGDWWVLGPVSIVEISPPCQTVNGRVVNGSMVNPVPDGVHGYDSTLFAPYSDQRYQSSLNVAIGVSGSSPLVLQPSTSLISVISQMTTPPSGSFSQLATAAVLTVLGAEPPADAFRPPYTGTDKTIRHREADLDYDVLGSLAPTSSTPALTETASRFQRVWLDHTPGWVSRYMHPVENMPDYGRDFSSLYGTGALQLQLNYTQQQKRDLMVRLTQIGIDFWGNVSNGCYWEGVGGQGSGRKFPILFAGAVLHDAAMSAIGTTHPSGYYGPSHPNNRSQFGEDCQTFTVQQTSPGVYNWGYGGYTATHVGLPEWGNNHTTWPTNDNATWMQDSYRRCCTGNAWVGQTLAARIMGLRTAWNHDVYFDYMDRYMQTEQVGQWTRCWEPWQEQMWDTYRSSH
jgi:hypothetical protein